MESFEIASFINATIAKFSLILEEQNLTIVNDVQKALITADSSMLSQVIVNLISNAVDHTNTGGKIVFSSELKEDVRKIRINLFNEGSPIPEEELDKIWLTFYKIDKA